MTEQTKPKVLVVGAGPVGLSFANELTRHGISCRIIDKLHRPTTQSRAAGIHARTLEVFTHMGLVDDILERGSKVHGVSLYSNDERIVHLDYTRVHSPYHFAIMLAQANTEDVLSTHLAQSGVSVDRDWELVAIEQTADHVTASLQDKDDNQITETFDYVVGCDGAHSSVRHILGFDFKGEAFKEDWVLADVDAEFSEPQDEIHLYLNDTGLFMIFPLGEKRYRIGADHRIANALPDSDVTEDELQNLLSESVGDKMKIESFHWLTKFRINHRKVDKYQQGRVFLAGDAAHIHSPAGGQGMNTGVQDGFNLAWKMALVLNGYSDKSLLDSYTQERSPIAQRVLQDTTALTNLITLKNPLAKKIRNRIIAMISQLGIFQNYAIDKMSELAVNYHESVLVREDWSGHGMPFNQHLSAGDRAPAVDLRDNESNLERNLLTYITSPKHHALLFCDHERIPGAVQKFNAQLQEYQELIDVLIIAKDTPESLTSIENAVIAKDISNNAHQIYFAGGPCLYLIRPDGYIAYRNDSLNWEQTKAYLHAIFNREWTQ